MICDKFVSTIILLYYANQIIDCNYNNIVTVHVREVVKARAFGPRGKFLQPGGKEEAPREEDKATLTPPEIFPRLPGGDSEEIDMDAEEITTPRPAPQDKSPDPDPTPRPSTAGLPSIGESSPSPLPK